MDNSLIAGMPEVVAYIKKIEEENKQLKEDVEQLKEKLSDTEYDLDSLKTDLRPLDDMMYEKGFLEPLKTILDVINWKTEHEATLEDFFAWLTFYQKSYQK